MSRYIDADNIEFFECKIPTICQPNKYSEAIIITKSIGIFAKKEQIDQIPSANVEPVRRHGHWIKNKGFLCCSECSHATQDMVYEVVITPLKDTLICEKAPYFCGKCGAKMDEKDE